MGPSFGKIPDMALPAVLMTWKICLLKTFIKLSCTTCILNNFYTYEDFKIGICTLKYMQIEAGL